MFNSTTAPLVYDESTCIFYALNGPAAMWGVERQSSSTTSIRACAQLVAAVEDAPTPPGLWLLRLSRTMAAARTGSMLPGLLRRAIPSAQVCDFAGVLPRGGQPAASGSPLLIRGSVWVARVMCLLPDLQ